MTRAAFFYFYLLALPALCWSKEVRHLMRSPKGLLMGDAYTAAVDDEYVLFYNPAAIGKSFGVYIHPLNPQLGATNALDDQERFKDLPKDAAGLSDRLMGFPVYVQAGASPGVRFGPVAFNLIANTSTSLVLRNIVHPFIDVDYRYDRGFVMGAAYTFGSAKKKGKDRRKSAPAGMRTSIGLSVKQISREGISDSIPLLSTDLLNQMSATDTEVDQIKRTLGYSKGSGWGGDLGFEHALVKGNTELSFAFSVLDVGGTKFRRKEGTKRIPEQEMFMNAGVAFKQDFTIFDYSLAFDLHPINEPMALGRKVHAGLEFGLPLVRGYAGLSEGYASYGVGFRLWPVEIIAGFYSVELGAKYKEEQGKRAVLYLSLLDFAFDIK